MDAISEDLLRTSRYVAITDTTIHVNTVKKWLKGQQSDKARICSEFVERRYVAARTRMETSNGPTDEAKEYRDAVEQRLKRDEFDVFIEL